MEGILEAIHSIGIGPCDNHEIGVLPGINGGTDFLDHLVEGNDLLALHMTALLRPDLIFDMDRCHACPFILMDSAPYIDGVAIAGIGIRDEGALANNGGKGCSPAHHLAHRQKSDIRLPKHACRCTKTCHVNSRKACLGDEACT